MNGQISSNATAIDALETQVTSLNNSLTPYHCAVYYAGSGDVTFNAHPIVFNTVIHNVGGCYSTSTGHFTAPVSGLYLIAFTYYSNNTATNGRATIFINDSNIIMENGPQGRSLAQVRYVTAGQTISVGPQTSSYPIAFFAASGHNLFTVTLLQKY
jgi:hypothetical protein